MYSRTLSKEYILICAFACDERVGNVVNDKIRADESWIKPRRETKNFGNPS